MGYAIKTENLIKRYKDKTAVAGLSLTVNEGELIALLGVNGAGKTTTVKMLTCLTKPTEGKAEIMGCDVVNDSASDLLFRASSTLSSHHQYASA
ncbi:ABC transporter [Ruminococcaceae bacterium YAD3003]|nr:ABC transporter [Ruminococcaceae bacterium YAD3003]